MYLAMLGPAFCLALALSLEWGRKRLGVVVTALVMVGLAGMSFCQLDIWKNDRVFFPYAVAQNPRSAEALRWVAFLDEVGGNYERAEATLRQAIEYEPKYADLYYNLGICLQFQKRYDEAIDAYQTALKLQPGMLVAHQNLALAYIDSSRSPEAGKHLQFLLNAGFQEFWVKEKLGTILLEAGDYAGAEKLYREALKMHPRWPEGYANFGIALAELGKLDDAALAFRAAIELDPRNESLKQNLQRLEELRQRK
jgi:tetratricopeptide (TPR) repeat protein